jgi:hypothetical protein
MAKVKFTGFATDSSGQRTRVAGETKTSNASRGNAENVARNALQINGYKNVHIDDATYNES